MSDGQICTTLAADGGYEIVLDRPKAGNSLTAAMTIDLAAALTNLPMGTKFVILRGEGADFCAGRVSPMPAKDARVTAATIREKVADPVLDFYAGVRNVPLPVIAVVRGRAHGVGCALAGLADIVIADDTAEFQIPEMDRDIPPLLVMTALAARLPRAAHARLVFSRQAIGAAEAVSLSLASEACSSTELAACLAAYREKLAANSDTTLRTVKEFLNVAPEMDFATLKTFASRSISAAVSERFVPTEQPAQDQPAQDQDHG